MANPSGRSFRIIDTTHFAAVAVLEPEIGAGNELVERPVMADFCLSSIKSDRLRTTQSCRSFIVTETHDVDRFATDWRQHDKSRFMSETAKNRLVGSSRYAGLSSPKKASLSATTKTTATTIRTRVWIHLVYGETKKNSCVKLIIE